MTRLSSLSLCVLLLTAFGAAALAGETEGAGRTLRVCADPDNLPFSNARSEGFENKIAQLVATDLHAALRNVWLPLSAAPIDQMVNTGKCDLIAGTPAEWTAVLTTKPYYASTYVFVYAQNRGVTLHSFDDPALHKLKIALPLMSSGGANPPAAYALARRGLAGKVTGFPAIPPGKIIDAVAGGEVDAAIVWGPLGGYFAKQQHLALEVNPVNSGNDDSGLRFNYAISMAVRKGDDALKEELGHVLERRSTAIRAILEGYGVPLVSATSGGATTAKATY